MWFGWSGDQRSRDRAPQGEPQSGTSPSDHDGPDRRRTSTIITAASPTATLWPLFHYRLDLDRLLAARHAAIAASTAASRGMLSPLLRADDIIWVHDYHLIPLAAGAARSWACAAGSGFFLHIPWPPPRSCCRLPPHDDDRAGACRAMIWSVSRPSYDLPRTSHDYPDPRGARQPRRTARCSTPSAGRFVPGVFPDRDRHGDFRQPPRTSTKRPGEPADAPHAARAAS